MPHRGRVSPYHPPISLSVSLSLSLDSQSCFASLFPAAAAAAAVADVARMKTATMGDDEDQHHQSLPIPFPCAFALEQGEVEFAAEEGGGGGGGGGPGALDMMQIDEVADWLLDLVGPLFDEPHGGDDEEDNATTSVSTVTADFCTAGDERMLLPTEFTDWDRWLLIRVQDLAANIDGDDDGDDDATSTAAEILWEMQIDKGDGGGWLLRFDDLVAHPHGDDAATATTAESWVKGDDPRQPGADDCGAFGDLPLDWWVPEPTGPPDQLAQGGGVLPDLEAALSLNMSWGPYE